MTANDRQTTVGLCEQCLHASLLTSARGSTFYLCKHSVIDPLYPRYPRLPVLHCEAYAPRPATSAADARELP